MSRGKVRGEAEGETKTREMGREGSAEMVVVEGKGVIVTPITLDRDYIWTVEPNKIKQRVRSQRWMALPVGRLAPPQCLPAGDSFARHRWVLLKLRAVPLTPSKLLLMATTPIQSVFLVASALTDCIRVSSLISIQVA